MSRYLALLIFLLTSSGAQAWEKHQSLMPWVLKTLSAETQARLRETVAAPCRNEDKAIYLKLSKKLNLNPKARVPATVTKGCADQRKVSGFEILEGTSVDDPDLGMDQDLDHTADPSGFRRWMGGTEGPTSQGFRHMYFGGWKISHPLTTFQIPLHAVGLAPDRVELVSNRARELFRAGEVAWGFRVLAWAMHYIQDLAQPFHSVQLVSLRIVPWNALLAWPPSRGFQQLVQETTRTVSNYHLAYEQYTLYRISESVPSPFENCLSRVQELSQLRFPSNLAYETADRSIELAPQVGRAAYRFFGSKLLDRSYNLFARQGSMDYRDYSVRPDLDSEREKLHAVTCRALSNAIIASQKLITWALEP